ncbi:MAG TPA: RNA polymerase sigma factor [Frankiaceae bacterium]|jgi:RNA polymerase sigma-70 factor (ECF subfamily)|nr:RNA polymerase sigma factor [Frankiaceae bacterium]
MDDLDLWMSEGYAGAYRTACLILRDPQEAEDAVQDAFLRAWRFRSSMPRDAGWKPWLYRVVVNACCSRQRRSIPRERLRADLEAAGEVADAAPPPEALALRAEETSLLAAALADLPEALRIPVVLRYYAGLSEKDIAAAIGRRPGTVKSRLYEARARLAADPRLRALVDEEAAR